MIIGTGATNAKWLTATITAEAKCFAKVVFTRVALKNKVFLKFASTAEMKGVTNDTTILILPHYGGEMERIMGAILGSTTDQAVMAFLLLGIAKRHGIDVEFDF